MAEELDVGIAEGRSEDQRLVSSLAFAVIIVATLLAYSNSFGEFFIGLDGKESIRDNPHIRQLWPLSEALSLPLWGKTGATVDHRPVLSLSFALNYQMFGLNPWGWHATNLMIHVAAAFLLFALVRGTLVHLPRYQHSAQRCLLISFVVALLWVLHPLHTEAVTYVVQRAESAAALFCLLTLYAAHRAFRSDRAGRWYTLSVLACALGMGTKETVAATPLIVLVYDGLLVSPSFVEALKSRWLFYLSLAATWIILGVLIVVAGNDTSELFVAGDRNLRYFLSQPRVILHYLRLAVFPYPNFLYVNTDLFWLKWGQIPLLPTLLSILVITSVFLSTMWGLWKRYAIALLGAAFFLLLAPSSSIVATHDVIQEHRMYLPLVSVVITLVLLAERMWVRFKGVPVVRVVSLVLALSCAGALGARTYQRNKDYHSEFSMIHPADLDEAYMILSQHYRRQGQLPQESRKAMSALDRGGVSQRDIAFAHFLSGVSAEVDGDLEKAVEEFRSAVESNEALSYAHWMLCLVLQRQGELRGADGHCRKALQLRSQFPEAHKDMGVVLAREGDSREAERHLRVAIRQKPDFAEAMFWLGRQLISAKNYDEATDVLR